MNTQAWDYRTEYNKLLDILDQDNRVWRPTLSIPRDGSYLYFKCENPQVKGDFRYDIGSYVDYTKDPEHG